MIGGADIGREGRRGVVLRAGDSRREESGGGRRVVIGEGDSGREGAGRKGMRRENSDGRGGDAKGPGKIKNASFSGRTGSGVRGV